MKKLLSIFISSLIIIGCTISTSAKTVVTYGDWVLEKISNGKEWKLDEYVGESSSIITPRFIDNKLVVAYGDHCCANNTNIKSVVTSSPLWTIGNYSFINCTSLEYFELNYALHTIFTGAFYGTTSLKSINLEDSIITEINPHTFAYSGLETVKFPTTCTKLGNYSFAECDSLTKVMIPDSVTEISPTAFDGCEDMTIYCDQNSYAAQYAEDNNLDYVIMGDVNGDKKVSIRDVTCIQLYRVEEMNLNEHAMKCADVTGDGDVTIRDATTIQLYLVEAKTSLLP